LVPALLPFGYDHAVIDGGWYNADNGAALLDSFGRPIPRTDLFPSAAGGAGFAPLAARIHGLGLQFGFWTIRGIPKAAVVAKLPIANSPFTADEAADMSNASLCSWDSQNYGILPNAAGRAYYESLAVLYKGWGVDIVKIDCMVGDGTAGAAAHAGLYTPDFTLFSEVFRSHGIALIISPGTSMNLANATYIAQGGLAEQVRARVKTGAGRAGVCKSLRVAIH
jgi:alpha-galactosidase